MIESALIRCDVRWAHLAKPTKMRKEAKCHVQLRIHLKKIDGFRSLVCCLVGKLFMTLLYHFKNNFSRTFILSLFHFESIALWRMKKKIQIPLYFYVRYILASFQRILELRFWVYTSYHFSCSQFSIWLNGLCERVKSGVYGFLSRELAITKFNEKGYFLHRHWSTGDLVNLCTEQEEWNERIAEWRARVLAVSPKMKMCTKLMVFITRCKLWMLSIFDALAKEKPQQQQQSLPPPYFEILLN